MCFNCIPNDNLHCPQIEYSEIKKHNKKTKNNPNLIKFIFMFDNKSCIHLVAQVNNFNQSNYYPEINRDKKKQRTIFYFCCQTLLVQHTIDFKQIPTLFFDFSSL